MNFFFSFPISSLIILLIFVLLFPACTINSSLQTPGPDNQINFAPYQTSPPNLSQIPTTPVQTPLLSSTSPQQPQFATPTPKSSPIPLNPHHKTIAIIHTSKGSITLELYSDQAPHTVENFISKASSGFYTGLTFHRVEDWVIQGGDPAGDGSGGGQMSTELNHLPFSQGSLGIARGDNINFSNDSQFFICTSQCGHLTGQYTNFGQVISGLDVAQNIVIGDTIDSIDIP